MLKDRLKSVLISGVLTVMLVGALFSSSLVGNSDASTIRICPFQCRPYEYQDVPPGAKPYYFTNTSPRTGIAMAPQTDDVLTGLSIGKDGAMYVTWKVGVGKWSTLPISPKGIFPPGANIAMAKQNDNLLTALAVGNNGAIYVSWVVGTGKWQGPVQITPIVKYPNLAKTHPDYPRFEYPKFPPGGNIAMVKQANNMLTALAIDNRGKLYQLWVMGTGAWNYPADQQKTGAERGMPGQLLTDSYGRPAGDCLLGRGEYGTCPPYPPVDRGSVGFAPGAPIAVHKQTNNIIAGLTVDNLGALTRFQIEGNEPPSTFSIQPVPADRISDIGKFPIGAGVAMAQQANNLLTGLVIGHDGVLYVTWSVGGGKWQGPLGISPPKTFPPGAAIAMTKQNNNLLTALAVGNNGALHVSWVVDTGKWQGPIPISPPNMFSPGAGVAMTYFVGARATEALTVGKDGGLYGSWVVGTGKWNGPIKLS